jgi:hypothetical protein
MIEYLPKGGWMDWNTFWTAGATILIMLGGIAGLLKWMLIGINEKFVTIDKKFDAIDRKFEMINVRLDRIETNIQSLDKRVTIIETILGMMTNGYGNHKEK